MLCDWLSVLCVSRQAFQNRGLTQTAFDEGEVLPSAIGRSYQSIGFEGSGSWIVNTWLACHDVVASQKVVKHGFRVTWERVSLELVRPCALHTGAILVPYLYI
jgi:hypothetical protein